jgi:hypothetical protein
MARTRVFSAAYAEDASVYETLIAAFLRFARNAASGTIRDALRVGTWPQTAISSAPIPINITGSPDVTPHHKLPSWSWRRCRTWASRKAALRKNIVQRLFVKARVKTRSQLVRLALEGSLGDARAFVER